LEERTRAQEARVEKVGRLLVEVGASEYLTAALRQEEERLRGLRQRLAEARRKLPVPGAKLAVERVAEVVRDVAVLANTDPLEARRALGEAIEPVVMMPTADGYDVEVTLKNTTAAPISEGGRVLVNQDCGGRI